MKMIDLQSEESFVIDHLLLHDFKKASFKQSMNTAIQDAERRGKLPSRPFQKIGYP